MLSKGQYRLGVVLHTLNLSTRKTEKSGFLSSRPECLQSEFYNSQGYIEKPSLLKKKKNEIKTKQKEEKIKRKVIRVSSLNLTD